MTMSRPNAARRDWRFRVKPRRFRTRMPCRSTGGSNGSGREAYSSYLLFTKLIHAIQH
jgi:hypothetical protein